VETFGDWTIGMMCAAAARVTGGVEIYERECVDTAWPGFLA
jgi:5-enolpyruvylshikimate-3-phosphate synthase